MLRIILGLVTVLIVIIMLVATVWFVIKGATILLSLVCMFLAVLFGVFVYHDYQYFFGNKK